MKASSTPLAVELTVLTGGFSSPLSKSSQWSDILSGTSFIFDNSRLVTGKLRVLATMKFYIELDMGCCTHAIPFYLLAPDTGFSGNRFLVFLTDIHISWRETHWHGKTLRFLYKGEIWWMARATHFCRRDKPPRRAATKELKKCLYIVKCNAQQYDHVRLYFYRHTGVDL